MNGVHIRRHWLQICHNDRDSFHLMSTATPDVFSNVTHPLEKTHAARRCVATRFFMVIDFLFARLKKLQRFDEVVAQERDQGGKGFPDDPT